MLFRSKIEVEIFIFFHLLEKLDFRGYSKKRINKFTHSHSFDKEIPSRQTVKPVGVVKKKYRKLWLVVDQRKAWDFLGVLDSISSLTKFQVSFFISSCAYSNT